MSSRIGSFDTAAALQYQPAAAAASASPSQQIADIVTSWPGVTSGLGSLGELAFRLGPREIGHLHGDSAHFGFPRHVWVDLRKRGRIERHPFFPDLVGFAARRIQSDSDVQAVIDLFRLNYDRLTTLAHARR